jgi:hypothetical protein
MRVRLLVIALFASASVVTILLADAAGLLHEPEAGAQQSGVTQESRLTDLGWPAQPLGLAGAAGMVVWTQPASDDRSGGLWAYDLMTQAPRRVLTTDRLGAVAGAPSMSGPTVVWPVRKEGRPTAVRAYTIDSERLFSPSPGGVVPVVGGDTAAWVRRGTETSAEAIGVVDLVTTEEAIIPTGGRVREMAAWGDWVAWTTGPSSRPRLWAVRYTAPAARHLLAAATSIAMDARRIVWSTASDDGSATISSWDPKTGRAVKLCTVPGPVSALTLGTDLVAWTRTTSAGADVWAYDGRLGSVVPLAVAAGDQVSPVAVGRDVFWADGRHGAWALYGRSLGP